MEHERKEKEWIRQIELGEVQAYKNVAVFPLFSRFKTPVHHLVLSEAIEKGLLTVSEVDFGGRVPELKVINNAEIPVMILDGEELFGAKQNRVLNTTVLLRKKSTTIIPVSCTEQGRWHSMTPDFKPSETMMTPNLRRRKNLSVQESLHMSRGFASDQGAIWNDIGEQAQSASISSPTQAMRDIHEGRKEDIIEYEKHFPCVEGQRGILVTIGGAVVGMDMISCAPAYALIHTKLVKSYVLDAILQGGSDSPAADKARAQQFLDDIAECEVNRYKSVGHGWDLRFQGKRLFGSALEYRSGMVHLAFFSSNGTGHRYAESGMAGYARRASYRRNNQGGNGS